MSNAAIVTIGTYNQCLASEACIRTWGFQRFGEQCTISDMGEKRSWGTGTP